MSVPSRLLEVTWLECVLGWIAPMFTLYRRYWSTLQFVSKKFIHIVVWHESVLSCHVIRVCVRMDVPYIFTLYRRYWSTPICEYRIHKHCDVAYESVLSRHVIRVCVRMDGPYIVAPMSSRYTEDTGALSNLWVQKDNTAPQRSYLNMRGYLTQ